MAAKHGDAEALLVFACDVFMEDGLTQIVPHGGNVETCFTRDASVQMVHVKGLIARLESLVWFDPACQSCSPFRTDEVDLKVVPASSKG